MIKKALIPALILAAASVALPAAAQSQRGYEQGRGHDRGYEQNRGHGDDRADRRDRGYDQAGYGDWQSINQRQANLDRRIDRGLRNGQLSRREAARLRNEFNGLLRLEAGYRRGGLTQWERADLDRRFDRLSASIRYERRDHDNRRG